VVRIVVFGATGGTGRQLVTQALDTGHTVTAVARRPAALDITHDRLSVRAGDVLEPDSIAPHLVGQDAVLSALGIGYRRHRTTVYSAGTANVMAAMRAAGVRRVVCVSTSGLDLPPDASAAQRLVFGAILHRLLREPYADMREMERRVRASDLDWTIVRSARMTNGARTGRYRVGTDGTLRRAWSIARADVAHYMVCCVADPATVGRTADLAY
jgi:putative NADH-flavin reductase